MDTKKCSRCGKIKKLKEFPKHPRGHRSYCIKCKSKDGAVWYSGNKGRVSENRKRILLMKRVAVIAAYGGKCSCCGEKDERFLCIDHVNGGGGKARKLGLERTGSALYHKIIQLEFPDTYQVLCHNCNMGKAIYGICPHKGGSTWN